MKFDFNGILFALSFALDCVEHDLLGVTSNHGKRVAALAMLIGKQMGVLADGEDCQILSACAVMHDCALSEYIQEEYNGSYLAAMKEVTNNLGIHCAMGEESMKLMPFNQIKAAGAVLYHHENADGTGPFGKKSEEIPQMAKLIHIADTVDAGFDLSWIDTQKREQLSIFLKEQIGKLFAGKEAETFQRMLAENDLRGLRNEKIEQYLHQLLPGGSMYCTSRQLMDFASVFARIVDYKSRFTKSHSVGIAGKAYEMALFYGAEEELAAELYFAGALHDIGKLVVDRGVLEKTDKLSNMEFKHIQTHAYYSYKILSDAGISNITKWAAYHHEKLDGTGYPLGLTGEHLGKWERLMGCLDIYQALTEECPYKKGMNHAAVITIMENMASMNKIDGDIVKDIDHYFQPKQKELSETLLTG